MSWPTKKLGELISFEKGKKMAIADNGDPYIGIENLRSGVYSIYTKEKHGIRCEPNDVLLVWDGAHAGTVGMGLSGFVGSTIVRVLHDDSLENNFLFYLLKFFQEKIRAAAQGAAIPHLSKVFINSIKIPLPPINIQKEIVERLDKIAEAQKLNDGLIKKTDELYRSLLHNELNAKFKNQNAKSQFEIKKLGEVADYINGRAFKPTEWSNIGLPIIRIQNLTETQEKFNYFNGEIEDKHLVKDGDILLSWSASLGVYIWGKGDAVLNQHIFKVIPHSDIWQDYLFHALVTAVEELKRRVHGSTMTHITKPVFNRVTIGVPPLETQKQIVAKLSAVQNYKKQLLEQKSKLKELFDSALAKSMTNK